MKQNIIVDTSIWIEYFQGGFKNTDLIEEGLSEGRIYTAGPIVAELLQGVKTKKEFDMLSRCLGAVQFIDCGYDEWVKAGSIAFDLRKKGITIPLTDIVIAVAAQKCSARIYTRDAHFQKISGIELISKKDMPC